MDDKQIINLYLKRSENAIAETDTKYGTYCFTIAERILNRREDSEETVNDTYLAVWNAIPPHLPPAFAAFIGKITRNLAIDRWRMQSSDKRGNGAFTLCLDELGECVSGEISIEQEILAKELTEALNRFLQKLPAVERQVFLCRYWYMDSIPEIAAAFGFSQTKVTTMLYRTRSKLRKLLEKEGF